MREVVLYKFCEFCWMDGETKEPATESWTLGMAPGEVTNPPVKVLDVCEKHHAIMSLIQQAHTFSSVTPRVGVAPPTAKAPEPVMQRSPRPIELPAQSPCPVCSAVLGKGSVLGHVWSQHVGRKRPEAPTTCPECGEEYEHPTACGAHRKARHGHDPLDEALMNVPGYRFTPQISAKGA